MTGQAEPASYDSLFALVEFFLMLDPYMYIGQALFRNEIMIQISFDKQSSKFWVMTSNVFLPHKLVLGFRKRCFWGLGLYGSSYATPHCFE